MIPVLRRIATHDQALFLTFDDGPDPASTPRVLDLLARHQAQATFFLVAERAREHAALVERIVADGHRIGNHSLDHRYAVFFKGRHAMLDWVQRSEHVLRSLGCQTVGFRPPVGIRTPELYWALHEMQLPMVLWRRRFFDAVWPWSISRAGSSLRRSRGGDIVLLHDRQREQHRLQFLDTLDWYLMQATRAGFVLRGMPERASSASR